VSPLLLLDFDDVLCLAAPYGGYDVISKDPPGDLFERLFNPPAVATLNQLLHEFSPSVVVTTSWLRFLERPAFETIFKKTGLPAAADALHTHWEAPQDQGKSRLQAVESWLAKHHEGEPFVVLDDDWSGTGLKGSRLDRQGRVVLCAEHVGLNSSHLPRLRRALQTPC
jgi:hypothetical protein